ncbi:alpha/beta hydrolase [Mumia zhuanghuii]|uniref:Lipase family alpha/beta hydrolase n=2 Tax=Mumia TaxID=1546255 RepID=A0ABW1QP86_9ACTN|nr:MULTISPECIES: alpha/beta hydrolase [Mumia]KAA1423760.1 alpha/beta hydrolase [Mumia zhuanghuii]
MPPTPRTAHTVALALGYADDVVVPCVREVHGTVARRVFGSVAGGRAPQVLHDAVAAVAYAGVSGGLRGASLGLRQLADRGIGAPVERTPRTRMLRSAVNALVGDRLADAEDPYALPMALRVGGEDVVPEPYAFALAYPEATSEIVVLVHGLGENDDSWDRGADRRGETYDDVLRDRTGTTPVRLRYNTGRHVSDNGADLSNLLTKVVAGWPVPVSRLHLVGHSMGGLVIRSATAYGVARRAAWTDTVATVVCLGTPHLGAPLERAVHLGSRALSVVPESLPFAGILGSRSAGITDLRHGYVTREEWHGQDLTARWGDGRLAVAPLPRAAYHFVAATADVMVSTASASGTPYGDSPVVDGASTTRVATGHLGLLNHPRVAERLADWVAGRPAALPAGTSTD